MHMIDEESAHEYNPHVEMTTNTKFHASQMPIKTKLKNLDDNIEDSKKDLEANKKLLQTVRNECGQLEHGSNETLNEMLGENLDDIQRLAAELEKITQTDITETNHLKQQIIYLNQERIKIQQNVIMLKSNVESLESDVGFE